MTKTQRAVVEDCIAIAGKTNGGLGGYLHLSVQEVLQHKKTGKLYRRNWGGAAMKINDNLHSISPEEAVDWIATNATDSVTGYGYAREQVFKIIAGIDPGPGYQGR